MEPKTLYWALCHTLKETQRIQQDPFSCDHQMFCCIFFYNNAPEVHISRWKKKKCMISSYNLKKGCAFYFSYPSLLWMQRGHHVEAGELILGCEVEVLWKRRNWFLDYCGTHHAMDMR